MKHSSCLEPERANRNAMLSSDTEGEMQRAEKHGQRPSLSRNARHARLGSHSGICATGRKR